MREKISAIKTVQSDRFGKRVNARRGIFAVAPGSVESFTTVE